MRSVVIWPGLVLSLMLGVGMGELILSQDLPPEMRADQYLLEGKRAVNAQDLAAALRAFEKLEALPVDPPPEFYYWYGKTLVADGISREDVATVNQGRGISETVPARDRAGGRPLYGRPGVALAGRRPRATAAPPAA